MKTVTLTLGHYSILLSGIGLGPHYVIELRDIASRCNEHDAKALLELVDGLQKVRSRATEEYEKSQEFGLPKYNKDDNDS